MSQLGLLFGHHWLLADGLIFVDVEVKNMNLKKMSGQKNSQALPLTLTGVLNSNPVKNKTKL